MRLDLTTFLVHDYDEAVAFFVDALGFGVEQDVPAVTGDGAAKRWVVVRPPDGGAGLLLARADGAEQAALVGRQHGGRVGHFLQVDDFDVAAARMRAAGVSFREDPRHETYGTVAVFADLYGGLWDLIGPPTPPRTTPPPG